MSKTKNKVNNRVAREYVQNCRPFEGSNIFGIVRHTDTSARYVVYSYGTHWPLWIREEGVWYENISKYGSTTSKHKTMTNPYVESSTPMEVDDMITIANHGIVGLSLDMGEEQ